MKDKIEDVFRSIDEIPLFYVESGSRLWGIASPDSDFDIRGFHLQSKRQYLDFKKHANIIEFIDGDFDFVSYDIDKMFGLLVKSNPTVFEWIRAHIVYFNVLPDFEQLQKGIVANFDFRALFHHYLSLANSNIDLLETNKKFTYKTVFYCIRGLLSAELASKYIIPELLIDRLFSQFETENAVLAIAKESLEQKKKRTEKEEVDEVSKKYILNSIKDYRLQLESCFPEKGNNRESLESILTSYSIKIKENYYK